MDIKNWKTDIKGRCFTCEIDGRKAAIPFEQKPTLTENGCLWLRFEEGAQPILRLKNTDKLFMDTGQAFLEGVVKNKKMMGLYVKSLASE